MELAPCEVSISLPPIPEAAQREQLKPATHVGRPPSLPRGQASPFARRPGRPRGKQRNTRPLALARDALGSRGTFVDGEPRAVNAGARGRRKAGVRPLRR